MDTKSSYRGSKAAPLIILPGLMCDSRMFAELLSAFPEAQVIDGFYAGCDRIEAMANYAPSPSLRPVGRSCDGVAGTQHRRIGRRPIPLVIMQRQPRAPAMILDSIDSMIQGLLVC